ncbi:MAG: peptidase M64, partial [Acidobacteria bacterium]|nr:peptidase M64 [Acidobacteriota bacterium]
SGCDEPSHGSFKATALGATFDSLGSERYLLTEDNKSLRDIAAHVPYDALYIMVNHKRYGGGGIYNLYCTFTTDNQWYEYLFLHEFGHSFAGLADEYYTSEVAYNEFYPRGVEPAEPNITALLEPGRLKWKNLTSPGVEIPTRWEKADFDAMDNAYQKIRGEINAKIAKLKREGADAAEVARVEEESERLSREHADKVDAFLRASKYWGKVGAFEGAGYAAQGLYRPQLDCLMFTKGTKPFCKVCEAAVVRTILNYTD